jgi:uncharacterized protein YceK
MVSTYNKIVVTALVSALGLTMAGCSTLSKIDAPADAAPAPQASPSVQPQDEAIGALKAFFDGQAKNVGTANTQFSGTVSISEPMHETYVGLSQVGVDRLSTLLKDGTFTATAPNSIADTPLGSAANIARQWHPNYKVVFLAPTGEAIATVEGVEAKLSFIGGFAAAVVPPKPAPEPVPQVVVINAGGGAGAAASTSGFNAYVFDPPSNCRVLPDINSSVVRTFDRGNINVDPQSIGGWHKERYNSCFIYENQFSWGAR